MLLIALTFAVAVLILAALFAAWIQRTNREIQELDQQQQQQELAFRLFLQMIRNARR